MKRTTIKLLKCVARKDPETSPCMGALELASAPSPSIQGDEIGEGALGCNSCGAEYPVLAGIAILVSKPFRYLRQSFPFLKGLLIEVKGMRRETEVWLNRCMLSDIETKDEKLFPKKTPFNEKTTTPMYKWLSTYVMGHYFIPHPSGNSLVDQLLAANYSEGPLAMLSDMGQRWAGGEIDLAVDLGCSVGGLTVRMGKYARTALGMDLSFEKVLAARRIVLGKPMNAGPFRLYREGKSYDAVPIPKAKTNNAEFFVASGDDVPLSQGCASIVASCNLVDVVPDPFKLIAEKKRLTQPGGVLLLSTPYLDHSPAVINHLEAGRGDPKAVILEQLSDFELLEEKDMVPWLLRSSDRHYDIYLDHCVAARRP